MAPLRWLLCCTLTAALVLPAPAVLAAGTFVDDDDTPYEEAIEALAADEIVEGCGTDLFCPDDAVQRGQTASLLSRAFDLPAATRDFFDDDEENVHEDAINRLARAGISRGCDRDLYCIGQTLQRDQMASLLVRAADLPATDDDYFRDGGGTHRGAMNALAAAGVTAGCNAGGTRFCGGREVTRGELTAFLARALDRVPRSTLKQQLEERRREAEQVRERRQAERRRQREQARKRRQRAKIPYGVWDRLAACESGGNWSINTGNGYYGGLQFSLASWRAVGGSGYPHRASRAEQIRRGRRLKAGQGWGAWPSCAASLGLR
jgi:hypothetical protein